MVRMAGRRVPGRRDSELLARPAHGGKCCLADVDAIDFRRAREGDRHRQSLQHDHFVKAFAFLGGKQLRIVYPARQLARIEDDGCRGDWPGKGAASRFVDPRHRPNPALQ